VCKLRLGGGEELVNESPANKAAGTYYKGVVVVCGHGAKEKSCMCGMPA